MIVVDRETEPTSRIPSLPVRQFTVAEYHQLLQTGILKSGDPFELLNGWIVPKMSINPPHNQCVRLLNRWLSKVLPEEWIIQVQGAITLSLSEPEPDVAIIRGPESRYTGVNPSGRDTRLVIEVAESSLDEDREEKLEIYALARIPIYWIVNLIDRQIEVYTLPRTGKLPTYRVRRDYKPGDTIPVILDGDEVATLKVADVMP